MNRIVIVGAGQAGLSAAVRLRREGFEGGLTLLGDEGVAPYQRPPLSKAFLAGKLSADRLALRGDDFYASADIELSADEPVVAIDRADRVVRSARRDIPYDALVLATGGRPRRLDDRLTRELDCVHSLRSMADANRLREAIREDATILVAGGGYVGLEVAASARQMGARVVLVESAPRILARVAADPTAAHLRALHRQRGVDLREDVRIDGLRQHGRGLKAMLDDGSVVDADALVVGIGIVPETRLATLAGLHVEDGIAVDPYGRTSDPAIWAAGDCTSFPLMGSRTRLESVPHAIDQAEHVAMNILGAARPYEAKPWFWSDQYDTKLQIAGLNRGYTRVEASAGAPDGSLSVRYFRDDRLIAVDCVNDARSFMAAKRDLAA